MGALTILVLILVFGLAAILAFSREYRRMFRKYKPQHFGQDVFQLVTRWQTSEWQVRARKKGITLDEWQRLCDQQLTWIETAIIDKRMIGD